MSAIGSMPARRSRPAAPAAGRRPPVCTSSCARRARRSIRARGCAERSARSVVCIGAGVAARDYTRAICVRPYPMSSRFAVLLSFTLALAGASVFAVEPPPVTPDAAPKAAGTPGADNVDLADLRAFTAVYSLVKQAYVDDIDDHRLMQAAIRGLLVGLDPHSEYLGKEQLDDLTED